jgi:hypothetical protein
MAASGGAMREVSKTDKLNVFISYSRADEPFADELRLGLEDRGYVVEIDKHSIRQGEEWKSRLGKLIAASDTVVFVLSPDSARSPICRWEVEEAYAQAKRIVPVLHRSLSEPPKGRQPDGSLWPEGPAEAPPRLSLLNYPRFDEGRSFMAGLRGLVQALESDLAWIEAHSRLAIRARDWDEGGRAVNRLMSGADIAAAKALVETRKSSAPPMLPVQIDFIQASEAFEAAQRSERERDLEERNRLAEEALKQSRRAQRRTIAGFISASVLLSALVTTHLPSGVHIGVTDILTKLPEPRSWSFDNNATRVSAILDISGRSVANVWQLAPSPVTEPIISVSAIDAKMSPDGQHVLVLDDSNRIFLMSANGPSETQLPIVDFRPETKVNAEDGRPTKGATNPDGTSADGAGAETLLSLDLVRFSFDGKWLLIPSPSGEILLVDAFSTDHRTPVAKFDSSELSPASLKIAAAVDRQEFVICSRKTVTLVSLSKRPMASSQPVEGGGSSGCRYAADGKLVIARANPTIAVFRIDGGTLGVGQSITFPQTDQATSRSIEVVASLDGTRLWGRAEHGPIAIADLNGGGNSSARKFIASPQPMKNPPLPIFWRSLDGRWMAGTGEDGDLFAWKADGTEPSSTVQPARTGSSAQDHPSGLNPAVSGEIAQPILKYRARSEPVIFSALSQSDRALLSNGRGALFSVNLDKRGATSVSSQAIGRLSGRNYGIAPFADNSGWQAISTADVQLIDTAFAVVAKSPMLLDEIGVTIRAGDGSGLWAGTETGLVLFRKVIKLWGWSLFPVEWPRISFGTTSSAGSTSSDGGRLNGDAGGGDGGGDGGGSGN